MSNIYKDQARDLANIPILRRDVIACVHLEDKDDMVFWDAMLQNQRRGKYHFDTHSKSQSGKETAGSTQCLRFQPYLSNRFFIGIDSDMRYLLQEPELDAAHFVCQTYTYSWENHNCEAQTLQERFASLCPGRACLFDFETFLAAYSSVVYKPLLLLVYCLKNRKPDFSRKLFNACLPHQCKGEELADNGKPLIERIAKNFEPYLNTPFAKSVDFEAERKYCQALHVNEQNAYLHVRGHHKLCAVSRNIVHATAPQKVAKNYLWEKHINLKNAFTFQESEPNNPVVGRD